MINSLTLTNFKKHETLAIDFNGGLVAIRGANEAGKSTIFQAVAYALYGSRSLPASLEGTVTYGKPPASLKVVLVFTHAGIEYTVTRTKAGAKMVGGGATSEGQAEVTSRIEALFGVPMVVASQLMIANQNKLRGALEGGGAIQLIEQLSSLDLIDDLVTRVQTKLPCGQTRAIETILANLKDEKEPTLDETPYVLAIDDATTKNIFTQKTVDSINQQLDGINIDEAHEVVNRASHMRGQKQAMEQRKAHCEAVLRIPLPAPVVEDVEALRKAQQDRFNRAIGWQAYQGFLQIGDTPILYQETATELTHRLRADETLAGVISGNITALKIKQASIHGKLILDESCNLCGKSLQDVPEVVQGNARVGEELAEISIAILDKEREYIRLTASNQDMRVALNMHSSRRVQAAKLEAWIETIDVVPLQCKWKGSAPKSPEADDYGPRIKAAELAASEAARLKAQREQTEAELATIKEQLPNIVIPDTSVAMQQIALHASLSSDLQVANDLLRKSGLTLAQADNDLAVAQANYNSAKEAYDKTCKQIQDQQALLSEYNANNALIKKLRDARPVVAKQLWATVLHGVSHYFGQIRGFPSVVTRSDIGFAVDTRPASDLSGSTLDSLGLAIRMALQKTFLPSLDFMLLDEPAAAADSARESNMLGLLAASGYTQVVLVTHSELADSFATQVLTI